MNYFVLFIAFFCGISLAQAQLAKLEEENKTYPDENGFNNCVKNLVLKQGNSKKIVQTFQAPCGGNVEEGSNYNLINSPTGNLQAFNSLEEMEIVVFNRNTQTLTSYKNHFGTPLFFSDDAKHLYGTDYDDIMSHQGMYGRDESYFSVYMIDLTTGKSKIIKWGKDAKKRTDGNIDVTVLIEDNEDSPFNWEETTKTYDKNLNPVSKNPININTKTDKSSREYAFVSTQRVTEAELKNYSKSQLRIMRNEIFATHGYIFQSQDLQAYFGGKSWYRPQYQNVDAKLSDIEKYNINVIKRAEELAR